MRKMRYLFFCLLFFVSVESFSQSSLSFKGYDLNCTAKDLATNLVKQGFTLEGAVLEIYTLKGTFAGENSKISIMGDADTKLVSSISVDFDEMDEWYLLKGKYLVFKSDLAKKYGEGKSTEKFSDPFIEGDGKELEALTSGNCTYNTRFKAQNGVVVLSIRKNKLRLMYVIDTKKTQEVQRSNDL